MRDYMDRRFTPPKEVTSPTWCPPTSMQTGPYAVVDEACRATNVLLIASATTVSWYTAFLRKHNPVLEMGHLSLVHLRSLEVWDRACLIV